jgi:predicted dehydrogenase
MSSPLESPSNPLASSPSRRGFLKASGALLAAGAAAQLLPATAGAADEPAGGRKLGYAVVGIGSLAMGQILPGFGHCKRSRPVALVSGHPVKAKQQAEKYGIDPKRIYNYENFDSIRDNPEIDVVYVVLPNSMHAEYTVRAAKAGKHVLCEKPMATSVADCQKMIDACKQAGRKLQIGYRLRFEPNTLALMDAVRKKECGELKSILAEAGFNIGDPTQWRLKRDMAGGGCLMDIGIYALQAAQYISGEEPVEVTAMTYANTSDPRFKEVEESCNFQLRFPSGVLASCISTYAYNGLNHFRGYCTNGYVEVEPGLSYHDVHFQMKRGNQLVDPKIPDIDQFATEMDAFSECILNDKPSRAPGEMGLQDMRIITAIYESAKTGKTVKL